MLRLLALLLIAANLGYLGWSQGWLDDRLPWRSTGDREPERMARQVRADTVVLHPMVASAPVAATACVESGAYAAAEVAAARAVLAPLLSADALTEVSEPGGAVLLRVVRADEALAGQLLTLRADAVRAFRRCAGS
jgi:hypothetical protein